MNVSKIYFMWIHFACCSILLGVLIVSGIKNITQKKEKK